MRMLCILLVASILCINFFTQNASADEINQNDIPSDSQAQQAPENNASSGAVEENSTVSLSEASSDQEHVSHWAVSLRSELDTWTVSRDLYSRLRDASGTGKYSSQNTIEKRKAKSSFAYGPEIQFTYQSFYAKLFLLQGDAKFPDAGTGKRRESGLDLGFGKTVGAFIGFRNLSTSFTGTQSTNIENSSISDLVWGLFAKTNPFKKGFSADMSLTFGLKATLSSISGDPVEDNQVFAGDLNFGYAFSSVPVRINCGFNAWSYTAPVKYTHAKNNYYSPPMVARTRVDDNISYFDTLEVIDNTGYGIGLKISYDF